MTSSAKGLKSIVGALISLSSAILIDRFPDVPEMSWPNALIARGKDSVRVQSVLDQLVEPSLGMVVEVERMGGEVHVIRVGTVLTEACLAGFDDHRLAGCLRLTNLGLVSGVEQHGGQQD